MKALSPRKAGGQAPMRVTVGQSSLGALLVAMTDRGLAAIMFDDDAATLRQMAARLSPDARLVQGDVEMNHSMDAVRACIDAPWQPFDLPLDLQGTPFQQHVWQGLQAVPYGTTLSYTGFAAHIGRPGAARAVAGACGANRLAVVIPCHRVIGHDGSLSGYRWGIQRKQRLLEMEQAARVERTAIT